MSSVGRIIRLSTISVPGKLDHMERDDAARRLMTLLDDGGDRLGGGTGKAIRLTNCLGEDMCVKTMRVPTKNGMGRVSWRELCVTRERALRDEYVCQRVALGLPSFVQTLGYGTYAGGPVLVTEWVQGAALRQVASFDLTALDCASIGFSVTSALLCARMRDARFVHRDLSPLNIMVRTDRASLEEQRARHVYDVCLIDLGSAICSSSSDVVAARTLTTDGLRFAWRGGTPEYAAPEMLSCDEGDNLSLRCSETVDTYALCSTLYELCCGTTPYRLSGRRDVSYACIKGANRPQEPKRWPADGGDLHDIVLACIDGNQGNRLSLTSLADALLTVCDGLDESVAEALRSRHEEMECLATSSGPVDETLIER